MVYNISHKNVIGAKYLGIRFNKIDGLIRVYDRTRYLVLFGGEKNDFMYNRVRYLGVKSGICMLLLIITQKSKLIHTILSP